MGRMPYPIRNGSLLLVIGLIATNLVGCSSGSGSMSPTVASIAVGVANPSSLPAALSGSTIPQGVPLQFAATATYTDQKTQDITSTVTWSSSAPNVASITATGVVTGVGTGTAAVQATLGNIVGSSNLSVSAAVLGELVVTPQNPSVSDAAVTETFKSIGYFSDGSSIDLTSPAAWSSTNPQVATVQSAGQVTSVALPTGQAAGFASIQAVLGAVKGVSVLSVTNHQGNGFAGVFTQHNDIGRTGQNINETVLTTANVNSTTFGKLFAQAVDGQVYAQSLYVPNVTIASGTHNVIYVATEADSVFAFDADNNTGTNANPLWRASLIDTAHGAAPGATPVDAINGISCNALVPLVGVTSTPVIDPSTNTMYVVAKSAENNQYVYRLHAIDITTGAEKSQGSVAIAGSVSGTGDGSSNGVIAFNPAMHLNRPGLLLLNGVVYVGFASNCDNRPFHGWLFAYDAATSSLRAVYVPTPNGGDGGLWNSGAGISADSNANVYVATGNGTFDTGPIPATDLGDSIVKLFLNGSSITVSDYFTPYNEAAYNTGDLDVGSGGVLLLPDQMGNHPHQLVLPAKDRWMYEVDRDQMTLNNLHYCFIDCTTDPQIISEFQPVGDSFCVPAYWNGNIYYGGANTPLTAYPLSGGIVSSTPSSSVPLFMFPGATPAISANGTGNGIVWAVDSSNYGGMGPASAPAILHAFDATNVANELYNTTQVQSRDVMGNAVKFVVPTIANGKVYVGTQTELDVYGLLSQQNSSTAKRKVH
jgi:Bacterial Ig-like domain (group 2)